MPGIFAKLNLKDQTQIAVLNAPESFEAELEALEGIAVLREAKGKEVEFFLAFVTQQKEVDALSKTVARKTKGDAVVWFAYPKGSSKKYTCEFNRDRGWKELGQAGFEPVRQVAIDQDWSALRFRRVEFIKTMIRSSQMAMSEVGKARVKK